MHFLQGKAARLALAFCLFVGQAHAGSVTLLGVGKTGAGAATPVVTYIGSATPTYASNVATATGANIGTASSGRLVVVVFYDITGVPGNSATVTIGGSAAGVKFEDGNTVYAGIAYLNVPTGTTANIAVTYGSAPGGFGYFDIYTITGLSSFTPVGTNGNTGSASSLSTTVATTSGGVVIAGANQFGSSSTTLTSTGSTETYTRDSLTQIAGFSETGSFSASGVATNASSNFTAVYNASSTINIVAASFR